MIYFDGYGQIQKNQPHTKVTQKKTLSKKSISEHCASFLKIWPLLNKNIFWLVTYEPDSETLTSDTREPVG